MREVAKIKYETIIKSDVSESKIYAFKDGDDDISVLSLKNEMYYWNPMCSTKAVWNSNYRTVEAAIEGVVKLKDYKKRECGAIMEFSSTKGLIEWAHSQLNMFLGTEKSNLKPIPANKGRRLTGKDEEQFQHDDYSIRIDPLMPMIKVNEKVPDGYWYSKYNGIIFNVTKAMAKRSISDIEGMDGVNLDQVLIISSGEYKGNAILCEHCVNYYLEIKK